MGNTTSFYLHHQRCLFSPLRHLTVSGIIIRRVCHLLHKRRAEVHVLIFKVDVLCDCDAVLGDLGWSISLLNDDVASLGPQRDLNGICELFYASQNGITTIDSKLEIFGKASVLLLMEPLYRNSCPKTNRARGRRPEALD